MKAQINLKILSLVLIFSLLCPIMELVYAEETQEPDIADYAVSIEAANNVRILSELYEEVDEEAGCLVYFEYDDQKRIIKITAKTGNVQEITEITYHSDNTYTKTKTVSSIETQPADAYSTQEQAAPRGNGNYDDKMNDPAVKNRIKEAQSIYNNGDPSMKSRANLEAQMARADYCVIYPKSGFATAFLESGNLSTGLGFRRVLQYKNPQMYGMDVMAVQRALIAYGYLDAADMADDQYGYFGPTTEAAVKDYQLEKLGRGSADGSVGKQTLAVLFSGGSANNKAQASFDKMNRINVFKAKHNAVCAAVEAQVGGDTLKEAYIIGAGLKGNGGRADLISIKNSGASKMVWEIKPDSPYGKATGGPQVTTYVTCSDWPENKAIYKYCPLQYGADVQPINLPWKSASNTVYISSICADGTKAPGVVFYSDRKNWQPIYQPAFNPVHVAKPNEDLQKMTWPEPKVVYNGLMAVGVAIAAVYIIKGAFALAAAVPSGGTSLLLLCF